MKTTREFLLISLALTALVLASPRVAAAGDESSFVAPEGEALVVFVQTLRDDRKMTYIVFDPEKNCVASVAGSEAEVVPMKPGQYTIYVHGYDTRRLELDVEAGRTYFIRVYSTDRFATRRLNVTPAFRGTESFKEMKTWLVGARVTHASDDPCRGKPLQDRRNRMQKRINEANADWKADEAYRVRHTVTKNDGLSTEEVARL